MVKLEKLLNHDKIRFIVNDEEYTRFLIWAKENDCLWGNEKIIQPYIDKPDKTTKTVVVTKDKLMYHPHGFVNNMLLQNKPIYYFKDISNDIVKDKLFEEQEELRQSIKDKQEAMGLQETDFKKRIVYQREINQKQLKYQKYTKTLPNQFFVKYNDTNELLDLFYVLSQYGYENYFNINPMYFDEKLQVLHIDNRGMHFSPTNTTCCACAVTAGIKFYEYKPFVEMIERIFGDSNEDNVQH